MDELIQAMSIGELQKFKDSYKGNDSITKLVDGYIEVKQRAESQAKAKADFGKSIEKLIAKLPHPEDVHNVYLRWAEIDVEDKAKEPELVNIEISPAKLDTEGNITEPAVIEPTPRYPMHKVWQWVVDLNKGFTVGRATSDAPTASKRAITVYKRDGLANVLVGNFPSASKACEYLKIPIGGDSASRVLNRDGYIVDAYTGTDFTS